MHIFVRGGATLLLLGDMVAFFTALILTLVVRYRKFPSETIFFEHLGPFSLLFVIWVLIFLITGLYDKHLSLVRKRIPTLVLKVQFFNILCAAVVFFIVPFGIEPKFNLAIYLVISTITLILWRLYLYPRIASGKPMRVLVVGESEEATAIARMFARGRFFKNLKPFLLSKADIPDFAEFRDSLHRFIARGTTDIVIADMRDSFAVQLIPDFYRLAFDNTGVTFLNLPAVYEQLYHRVPPSLIGESWLLENVSAQSPHYAYDLLKRLIDIVGALVLMVPALCLFPFIMLALHLEGGRGFFYHALRIGQYNKHIRIIKFRTMSGMDNPTDALKSTLEITPVGAILRKTRLDELPQLINVLRGDLSFIGPRPEIPTLVDVYAQEIPYYKLRHLVKPGLSGWAQINNFDVPRGGVDIPRTIDKLSFDLYYLKHRSFILDIEITLKTINTLFLRSGT